MVEPVRIGIIVFLGYAFAVFSVGALVFAAVLRSNSGLKVNVFGQLATSFGLGQGVVGCLWTILALQGAFSRSMLLVVLGICVVVGALPTVRLAQRAILALRGCPFRDAWERNALFWIASLFAILGICLLQGFNALAPRMLGDALFYYLLVPKAVAASGHLSLQPFASPLFALTPVLPEMHFAALFSLGTETAVTMWDWSIAVNVLLIVWALARLVIKDRSGAFIAVLVILSTPGFSILIGGGKTDIAGMSYGLLSFYWALTVKDWKCGTQIGLTGLFLGFAVASRYQNTIVVLPLLMVLWVRLRGGAQHPVRQQFVSSVIFSVLFLLPLSILFYKNIAFVGNPVAPFLSNVFGGRGFWVREFALPPNVSTLDLILYPITWTFAHRVNMLGGISPLYLVALPAVVICYPRFTRSVRSLFLAGLLALVFWHLLQPFSLKTRYVLVPLGLLAIVLAYALVEAMGRFRAVMHALMVVFALMIVVVYVDVLITRGAFGTFRYVTGDLSREQFFLWNPNSAKARYYRVADWMNEHVEPGERVALRGRTGYWYFLDSEILFASESARELDDLAKMDSDGERCKYYTESGFDYLLLKQYEVTNFISACFAVSVEQEISWSDDKWAIVHLSRE